MVSKGFQNCNSQSDKKNETFIEKLWVNVKVMGLWSVKKLRENLSDAQTAAPIRKETHMWPFLNQSQHLSMQSY